MRCLIMIFSYTVSYKNIDYLGDTNGKIMIIILCTVSIGTFSAIFKKVKNTCIFNLNKKK